MMCIGESWSTPFQNRPSLDPTPGVPPRFLSWDSLYLLLVLIQTNKSRFGDMQLTKLVSGETVTVGYGYRTDQYLSDPHPASWECRDGLGC